jgi:hypothetical protein
MITTASLAPPEGARERFAQSGDRRKQEDALVDHCMALRVDADVDFPRPLLHLIGIGLGQGDLQLGNALVCRRPSERSG